MIQEIQKIRTQNPEIKYWEISSFACSEDTIYLDEPISLQDAQWHLIGNGNGQKPFLSFDYSIVEELQKNGLISKAKSYAGYKPYVIFDFINQI